MAQEVKPDHVNIVKMYKDGEEHNVLGENVSQFLALGFTKEKAVEAVEAAPKK